MIPLHAALPLAEVVVRLAAAPPSRTWFCQTCQRRTEFVRLPEAGNAVWECTACYPRTVVFYEVPETV